jgi:hypothetical protein
MQKVKRDAQFRDEARYSHFDLLIVIVNLIENFSESAARAH